MLPIPCSMSYLRVYMMIWVPHKKMAHSDQDLTHLKFSDSFSKSPFCGPKWNRGHARQLVLVSNIAHWCLKVFRYGESFGTIYVRLRSIWRSKTGWRGCRKPWTTSRSEIVTLVLSMLETWFWCQIPYFWVKGIIWDHFQEPQLNLKVKNRVGL